MGWYGGRDYMKQHSLAELLDSYLHPKDYSFKVHNTEQADKSVIDFISSPMVLKDIRVYTASATAYKSYKQWCYQEGIKPVSSWAFKRNLQLLGFVYLKHKRFYAGYYGNKVTTAFKYLGIKAHL